MTDSRNRGVGRPRSEASRAALLDAAYWRMLEVGYSALSVEAVVKAAGAGKQTLYRWWPNKAALVIEALYVKAAGRIDRPREAAQRGSDVAAFLRAEFAGLRPLGPSLAPLLADASRNEGTLAAFREAMVEPRCAALRQILARRGVATATAAALVEAIDGAIWRALTFGEALDDALALRLAGLAAGHD
jgi:AcrR family transcriptional regulator